mmetsp:Transcript_6866/g.12494  ORF Transcript_6866/g.12494 Transcript_6866/m.12494 type:complete len:188 (+) Transcript_6866:4009-4572(+)
MKRSLILDKTLKSRKEVSKSAFSFLFSEIVHLCIERSSENAVEIERQLEELGYSLGPRFLELVVFRESNCRKETSVENILRFIFNNVWVTLFGKRPDDLQVSNEEAGVYMIFEQEPSLCNMYVCFPRGNPEAFNSAAFVAGIIEGMLNAAEFPCRVTANFKGEGPDKQTVFQIKFASESLRNELKQI